MSLNSNRGGEYELLDYFCKVNYTRHIYIKPYKFEQNRIVKRRNKIILDMTSYMMTYAYLPGFCWKPCN